MSIGTNGIARAAAHRRVGASTVALDTASRRHVRSTAYLVDGDAVTYGELFAVVRRRAATVRRRHGAHPAAPLALIADSSVDAVADLLAVLSAGHVALVLDGRWPPAAREAVSTAHGAVALGETAAPDGDVDGSVVWWDEALWHRDDESAGAPTALDWWRTAVVVGGAGHGAIHTHEEVHVAACDLARRAGLRPGTVFDLPASVATLTGLVALLAGLTAGATVVGHPDPR